MANVGEVGTRSPGRARRLVARGDAWLHAGPEGDGLISPVLRRLGFVWIAVSLPFTTAVSALVASPGSYVFVLIFMAAGAYTTPGLVAGAYDVRHAPRGDRPATPRSWPASASPT